MVLSLKEVVGRLNSFAPLSLAASWDNVGLLLQPSGEKTVERIFLTNDLTEPVIEEALNVGTDLIISYHPPIFRPFNKLTTNAWKERLVLKCVENKIALYSPHTAWDSIQGGINDWLLLPYGAGKKREAQRSEGSALYPGGISHTLSLTNTTISTEQLQPILAIPDVVLNVDTNAVNIGCKAAQIPEIMAALPLSLADSLRITKHETPPLPGIGAGRILDLHTPISLEEAVTLTKKHLGLGNLRLAVATTASMASTVRTIAVCAGSGSSVIGNAKADLLVTGEMSHHEVLDCVHNGSSVILAEHSNTERGFHRHVRAQLVKLLDNQVEIHVSEVDRDPLQIV